MLKMAVIVVACALTVACSPGDGDAGGEPDFFKGKTVSYIVPTNAGGGYDAYGRMISAYFEKHLGADHVVIRNVPGAGHIVGANTLWRSRPDGLTVGTFNGGLVYRQLLGTRSMQFDLREFSYIGKASDDVRAIVVSQQCHVKTMDDLRAAEQPVRFASAGIGSASHTDTKLLAEALDLNVELITGYAGQEGEMAMLRGEVCAMLGFSSSFEDFVAADQGSIILTIGGHVDGVPNAMDLAETERAKTIISLIDTVAQLGRITAAPPGVPVERLELMRAAYKASLEDPGLLAEARRARRPIDPAYGDDVKALIVSALDQSAETLEVLSMALE